MIVCFDAGNLLPVAKLFRAEHPDIDLIVCADNDAYKEINNNLKEENLKQDGEAEDRQAWNTSVTDYTPTVLPPKEPAEFGELNESLFELEVVGKIDYEYVFGKELADYIEKLTQASLCSKEYILVNFLVITSVVIGNKRTVKIHNGWIEPVHLWGALVGSPGCKKTSSMKPFYDALMPLGDKRRDHYGLFWKKPTTD